MDTLHRLDPLYSQPRDGGRLYVAILNPRTCNDFDWLTGQMATVDGVTCRRVLGVELFMHSPPWLKGEKMGVLLGPHG